MSSELSITKTLPSDLTSPHGEHSGVDSLPLELFLDMIRRDSLNEEDIFALRKTCTHFYALLNDDTHLWSLLFQRVFGTRNKPERLSYQEAYKRVSTNLAEGIFTTHQLQKQNHINSITLVGDILFSSDDYFHSPERDKRKQTFRYWNLQTNECLGLRTLPPTNTHPPSIIANNKLIIGIGSDDNDNKLKIIDLDSGECLRTLEGHLGKITCLAFAEGRLFSGDLTGTIMIWNIETGKGFPIHEGHAKKVTAITASRKRLISASMDGMIIAWDLETLQGPLLQESRSAYSANRTFTLSHNGYVDSLVLTDDRLITGSRNGERKILDAKTGICLYSPDQCGGFVRSLIVAGKIIISSSQYSYVEAHHLKTGKFLGFLTNDEFDGQVFSGGKLIGTNNRGIKVLDFMVEDTAVFEEIARDFKRIKDSAFVDEPMRRFSRMPKQARNEIYRKLHLILKPFEKDYWGCAEDAFHDRNGLSSTPEQKAQAIENHLAEKVQR